MENSESTSAPDLARQPSRLQYIAVLRAMAMLVVVAFHTYGYMYASHFPQSREGYNAIYYTANQCVFINVAMPLFTAIAGFLFAWLFQQGKYKDYWLMLRKKALRLLLPFIVFGTLMMATTGVPFQPWMLYRGSISHLWYLTALFWCFAVGGITQRHLARSRRCACRWWGVFFLLLFANSLADHIPALLGVQYLLRQCPALFPRRWLLFQECCVLHIARCPVLSSLVPLYASWVICRDAIVFQAVRALLLRRKMPVDIVCTGHPVAEPSHGDGLGDIFLECRPAAFHQSLPALHWSVPSRCGTCRSHREKNEHGNRCRAGSRGGVF